MSRIGGRLAGGTWDSSLSFELQQPTREAGVPFVISATRDAIVSYSCGLVISADGSDAGAFLMADPPPAVDPTTIIAKASIYNYQFYAAAGYGSARSNLFAVIPAGWVVKLQANVVAGGGFSEIIAQEWLL